MERTFCIIKPDAVARNLQGEILAMIQGAGLRVVAMKQIRMTRQQAEGFYAVHKAESIEANSVHGSDAPETAAYEMAYFFNALEITG